MRKSNILLELTFLLLSITPMISCWIAATLCLAQTASSPHLDAVYRDESHCLTLPDMRGDQDKPISCYCRDAVADEQYMFRTYLGKDTNLNGAYLVLEANTRDKCGPRYQYKLKDWTWDGPEVVRTYPSDDVIKGIKLQRRRGLAFRRVPYSVTLLYRDAQGHIVKTQKYSSVEIIPELPPIPVKN